MCDQLFPNTLWLLCSVSFVVYLVNVIVVVVVVNTGSGLSEMD
jgi:hypothetical protein